MIKMKKSKYHYILLVLICSLLLLCAFSLKMLSLSGNSDSSSISHDITEREKTGEKEFGSDLKVSADLDAKNGYGIVVGISNYPGSSNDLSYCDDDAQEIYSMLINDYNFKSENIIYLQDSAATKNAISSALDTITAQITPDDVFFFYYSGHGGAGTQSAGPYSYSINSPHPYSNNADLYWDITHPGAVYMRVHFTTIDVEYSWDYVLLGDSDLHNPPWPYYQEFTGTYTNRWSGWIPLLSDNTLTVNLYTDSTITDWGFAIDQYEVQTYDGSHYLCSYDSIPDSPSNYYLDTLLDSKLDAMNCDQKYVVMDSCNSGGLIPETQSAGRYIMSASQDDEFSLEDSARQNGCFTYNFLNSLDNAVDSNGDGVISMEEQYDYTYSTTVSRSTALGYTHHPQEYDGISGESILETSLASVSLNKSGNQLNYSFQLCGVGEILNLSLIMCNVNATDIVYEDIDLTENATSNTGFETYSGSEVLEGSSNISSYGLIARIQGNSIISLENINSEDYDNDSVDDLVEIYNQLDPRLNDTDSDGLDDGIEYYGDTDPLLEDTDGDGLFDGDEVLTYLTNATNVDTDNDGLEDGFEILTIFTNALESDTDGDLMLDGYEYYNDLNYTINDANGDYDGDGLINLLEFQIGTQANNTDSDGDLMSDGYEYYNDLEYMISDANGDYDDDGLINLLEFQIGTQANNNDSDGDLMFDGYEYDNDLDYTINDAGLDYDNDDLTNYEEFLYESDPQDSDTDNDGLSDGSEVNVYQTDLLNPDTDGDGFSDGMEIAWGSDPRNPRDSITTIILNYSGIVVLGVIGVSSGISYVSIKKHKKGNLQKFKKNFKITSNIDKFNGLLTEKVEKLVPKTYQPYPYIKGPSLNNLNLPKTKIDILNFLTNKLPTPHSMYSPEGKKAIIIANMALEYIKKGELITSIDYMVKALLMGLPEPYNSQIKNVLITTLKIPRDQNISTNKVVTTKKCMSCGAVNKEINKFCIKCGKQVSSESVQSTEVPKIEIFGKKHCNHCEALNKEENKFCVKCGKEISSESVQNTEDPKIEIFGKKHCNVCGTLNDKDSIYCIKCRRLF